MEEETAQESAAETAPTPPGRGRRVVGATGRGLKKAGSATGRGASYTFRQARRASHAEGAGDSGLYRLIELHAFNAAGDAAVAISLAGTLFFAQPGEARGQVALFLGPDDAAVRGGRAAARARSSTGSATAAAGRSASTMALRAFLCWLMADAVATQSLAMFPTALGVLVASKAYGVARAATVPRLQPPGLTLVKANSRISLAGVVGAAISAPLAGAGLDVRLAVVAALRVRGLRRRHDPLDPAARPGGRQGRRAAGQPARRARSSGCRAGVVFALRCNAGLRMLSGFLTMYMAFLLRQYPLPGWEHKATLLMGLVIGAAGLGQHDRHRARQRAAQGHAVGHGRRRPARGRGGRGGRGGVLRVDPGRRCSVSRPAWRRRWASSRWTR